jgi:hypothetical protein
MEYDVALSFAGEDRKYVEAVAIELRNLGVKVFYDGFEIIKRWGTDLYTGFNNIFESQAKYTVIFISKHYARKRWTNHERKGAQARALRETSVYILPARFDDTEIEGILPTTAFIDLRECSPIDFAVKVQDKLELELEFGTKGPQPVDRHGRITRDDICLPFEVLDNVRGLHTEAHRMARLLVSEILLYNEVEVEKGRQLGDLYERLHEWINRTRDIYNKRFGQNAALNYDYFHYEIVNSLAQGDFSKLGLVTDESPSSNQCDHTEKHSVYLSTEGSREHQVPVEYWGKQVSR